MTIRDRIKSLRRVRAGDLEPHPDNWRKHPPQQQAGMLAVLNEVGYADAVVARELPTGRLQLLDGHLRAATTPEAIVPVLVVDLNDEEAAKVLLTHDSLAALAQVDKAQLAGLLETVQTESTDLQQLLQAVAVEYRLAPEPIPDNLPEADIPETYQVVVDCTCEQDQRELFEQMRKEGRTCRVLTL